MLSHLFVLGIVKLSPSSKSHASTLFSHHSNLHVDSFNWLVWLFSMVIALWDDHHWWIGVACSSIIVATLVEYPDQGTMELDGTLYTHHHVAIRMA